MTPKVTEIDRLAEEIQRGIHHLYGTFMGFRGYAPQRAGGNRAKGVYRFRIPSPNLYDGAVRRLEGSIRLIQIDPD
jgi:hypothetical protein